MQHPLNSVPQRPVLTLLSIASVIVLVSPLLLVSIGPVVSYGFMQAAIGVVS